MTLSYILQFIGIVILAAPSYILVRWLVLRHKKRLQQAFPVSVGRELCLGLFFLYVVGLFMMALVLGAEYASPAVALQRVAERIHTGEGINLVPFRTISSFAKRAFFRDFFMVNIVGNIIMFVPWGFGLVLLWKKNRTVPRIFLWSAVLPLFIETCQLFVGRSVDVDDFILNFAGSAIGGLVCLGWMRRRERKKQG